MKSTTTKKQINLIVNSEHWDPFEVLGIHPVTVNGGKSIAVRAFLPEAAEAWVVEKKGGKSHAMQQVAAEGFFEAVFPDRDQPFPYCLRLENAEGHSWELEDPYRFPPVLSDFDLHLMGEGSHYKKYEKLGAHLCEKEGVKGVSFAVWAPNAKRVSVVGDFNRWDGRRHPMRIRGLTGVWEIFIPGLVEGEKYKFEIKSKNGDYLVEKSDPYAFYAEMRPKTASLVHDINRYQWNDDQWMNERERRNALDAPVAIYEMHPGSWRRKAEEGNRFLTYHELADELIPYVKEMGFTHIELMPVTEHPFDGSWGYQTVGYYAPTSRFGTPEDFMYFVDRCHQEGIGVLLDWVPAHFPKDGHGLSYFDGTHLYEHEDPRLGEHQDWGTLIYNFGRNEVSNFLLASALFWLDKYHLDGLRVDAVASMLYLDYSRKEGEWLPNRYGGRENLEAIDFLKRFNELIHQYHPGVMTCAEESTSWGGVSRPTYTGGLGFSMKWNMGWMHDTLEYFSKDPIHRRYHHGNLTFSLLYAFTENFILPFSHDEVVHGKRSLLDKMPGDFWQRFANMRLLLAFMYGHPGKKLLFMGAEIGQWKEWNFDGSLDWHLLQWEPHHKLQKFVADLNKFYQGEPSLHQVDFDWHGFEWIDFHDADNSSIAFLRRAKDPADHIAFAFNFTPVPRTGYRLGVPEGGFYQEVLNSDSEVYYGSNMGNSGGVMAEPTPWQGKPFSINIVLPPLAAVAFKLRRE
ncbi:MAG: 1,4-alpha-glucan branching protein GlgB [Nitrospirota bacterium]|nr:1,4-alpha-glucan branching protein GlgB [Nitrospirota bacterium]